MVFLYIKRVKANDIMITVNLTEQQLSLMEELVGEKFNEVAQAWLPASETEDMNKLCYDTLLNLRCVRMSKSLTKLMLTGTKMSSYLTRKNTCVM